MKFIVLCIFFILLLCSGCSGVKDSYTSFMGGEDNTIPPTPLVDIEQKITISKLWERDVGDGSDKQYLKLIPVHANEKIFVAENSGEVMAFDLTSGKEIWSQDTNTRITGGPGAGNNLVTVGTGKAEVITLSADSGEILWTTRVTSEILAAPQIAGNIILARTIDGKIFGLNAENGERLWIYERSVPSLTLRGSSTPVVAGDYIIAGFDDGRLAAIELQTGKLVWETRLALGSGRSELERMVDINADPVIKDGIIYAATFQGRVAALDLQSGRILWTREISSYAGLCVDSNAVYITDDDSAVWALDRMTGVSIWKQESLMARAVTAPDTIGQMVVVGDLEGYLHWMDKGTGDFIARNKISSKKIIAPPISFDNVLYSYASDGTLAAYVTDQVSDSSTSKPVIETESEPAETESLYEQEKTQWTPKSLETSETQINDPNTESNQDEAVEQEETVEDKDAEQEEKGFFGRLLDRVTPGD
jgi:outer membrane protein assembly factor BamB